MPTSDSTVQRNVFRTSMSGIGYRNNKDPKSGDGGAASTCEIVCELCGCFAPAAILGAGAMPSHYVRAALVGVGAQMALVAADDVPLLGPGPVPRPRQIKHVGSLDA